MNQKEELSPSHLPITLSLRQFYLEKQRELSNFACRIE
ncbi:hypothetical protein PORCAN_2062 [Porphyromonas crevioricanis JCM 13913]|nr:hypothetical protein PORCAN_2062 [Porphyromonas crevioricanis JCM 13913]